MWSCTVVSPAVPAAAARKGLKNRLSRLWKGAAGETGPAQVRRRWHFCAIIRHTSQTFFSGAILHELQQCWMTGRCILQSTQAHKRCDAQCHSLVRLWLWLAAVNFTSLCFVSLPQLAWAYHSHRAPSPGFVPLSPHFGLVLSTSLCRRRPTHGTVLRARCAALLTWRSCWASTTLQWPTTGWQHKTTSQHPTASGMRAQRCVLLCALLYTVTCAKNIHLCQGLLVCEVPRAVRASVRLLAVPGQGTASVASAKGRASSHMHAVLSAHVYSFRAQIWSCLVVEMGASAVGSNKPGRTALLFRSALTHNVLVSPACWCVGGLDHSVPLLAAGDDRCVLHPDSRCVCRPSQVLQPCL